jgi:hypothetical protein
VPNPSCAALDVRHVLEQEFPWLDQSVWAKRPRPLPVVVSQAEVGALLSVMEGLRRVQAALLYGSGLRLITAVQIGTP